MKLCLNTYNLGKNLNAKEMIKLCNKYGYAAIEFRTEKGHVHGVEPETTTAKLKEIRLMMEDAYLETASIATGCRFESPDVSIRKQNIENAKRHVEMAKIMDCSRIRVFGNLFPQGIDRETHVGWVGEALREIAEFAVPYGVDVLLEMHQDFNYWKYSVNSVKLADMPNVGIVYNCDPKDVIGGSVEGTYNNIKKYLHHIHMHCFLNEYPYKELFGLLKRDGYEDFLSAEVDEETGEPDRMMGYYSALYYALLD